MVYRPDFAEFVAYDNRYREGVVRCLKEISVDALAEIAALYEHGRPRSYAEEYRPQLQRRLQEFRALQRRGDAEIAEEIGHYLTRMNLREFIADSLRQLGQLKILAATNL